MNLYNEKENAKLLSDINDHIDIKIEDYYDTSDWIGCFGCRGLMSYNHRCEWCVYIKNKHPDPNFKPIRFTIDKEIFPKLQEMLDKMEDQYWFHHTTQIKERVEKVGLYPTSEFYLLKQTLITIGCNLSDMDIIQLNLGNIKKLDSFTYDSKLAIVKELDIKDPPLVKYDIKTKMKIHIDAVEINIKMSTIGITDKLKQIFS